MGLMTRLSEHRASVGRRRTPFVALPLLGLVVALLGVGFHAGERPAEAQAGSVLTGVYNVVEDLAPVANSQDVKVTVAACEPGDQVLGGVGYAVAVGTPQERVAIERTLELTQLQPFGPSDPVLGPQGFAVRAVETAGGTTGSWYLRAEAMCAADRVAGHQIVTRTSEPPQSPQERTADVQCPNNKVVLGSGGAVNFQDARPELGVGLTMARPTASGNAVLVEANERPGGYSFNWRVTAVAVCATEPLGYAVRSQSATGTTASRSCGGLVTIGSGAVADTTLAQSSFPGGLGVSVLAPRNGSGFIAAYAICADARRR